MAICTVADGLEISATFPCTNLPDGFSVGFAVCELHGVLYMYDVIWYICRFDNGIDTL